MSNFNFQDNGRRTKILKSLINSYGVGINNNKIYVKCTDDDFALKMNMMIQCLLKVSDMLLLYNRNVLSIFSDEVESFFIKNDIRFSKNISFLGKSNLNTKYDFIIPGSIHKNIPERCIVPINKLKSDIVKSTIFSWDDVKDTRPTDSVLYAIINDTEIKDNVINNKNVTAFENYGIKALFWSDIEKNKELLTA